MAIITTIEVSNFMDYVWADSVISSWMNSFEKGSTETYILKFPSSISAAVGREIVRFCGRTRLKHEIVDDQIIVTKYPNSKLKLIPYLSIEERVRKRDMKVPSGITKVLDNLFLGSIKDANDVNTLRELGITRIINVTKEHPSLYTDNFVYLNCPIHDLPSEDIYQWFKLCSEFINKSGEKAFIHCAFGYSRSASIVLAHLITCQMTLKDAWKHVVSKRPIRPNKGFAECLIKYEIEVLGSSSMSLDEWVEEISQVSENKGVLVDEKE